jgi:hypothetical protein
MKDELREAIARELFERDEYRGYDRETRDNHWLLRRTNYLRIVDLVAERLSTNAPGPQAAAPLSTHQVRNERVR